MIERAFSTFDAYSAGLKSEEGGGLSFNSDETNAFVLLILRGLPVSDPSDESRRVSLGAESPPDGRRTSVSTDISLPGNSACA